MQPGTLAVEPARCALQQNRAANVCFGSFSTELSRQQVGPCPLCSDSDPILQPSENVAKGQNRTHAPQQIASYSITSSAIASTPDGIVRPNALAVLRLMTSSTFVDCSTGKS